MLFRSLALRQQYAPESTPSSNLSRPPNAVPRPCGALPLPPDRPVTLIIVVLFEGRDGGGTLAPPRPQSIWDMGFVCTAASRAIWRCRTPLHRPAMEIRGLTGLTCSGSLCSHRGNNMRLRALQVATCRAPGRCFQTRSRYSWKRVKQCIFCNGIFNCTY